MRPAAAIVVLALLAPGAGCASDPTTGYAAADLYPTDISTVAVPIVSNDTYTRDVEFELTAALIKEIEKRTPYKVTPETRADSILLGHIRAVDLNQLSKSRLTGLSEEAVLSVTIDFEWRDLRTGTELVARRGFSGHGLFVPSTPSSEPIELGRFAAVQQLARDIVDEMQADW